MLRAVANLTAQPRVRSTWALTRRAALGVLAAGAVGSALWRPTPRGQAGVPRGRVAIEYWEKWTGPEGDAVQALVDRFNQSQDRIWVRRLPVSEIKAKAMVAISGGDPPDVVGLFSFNVPQFAEARAALPFDELESVDLRIDPETYAPAVLRLLTHEGRQWAGVTSVYNLALYYNRAMFREAGLDPDRPPRTVSELDAASERLLIRASGGGIARAGFLQRLPEWWPYFWPVMFGGRLYDPVANRALLTDAPTIAAYQWVQETARRLGPEESARFAGALGRTFHSPQDPFISGKAAMIIQGPWIANFIRLYRPDLDYGAAPAPVDPAIYDPARPRGLLEADVLMIPRGCRHPREAYTFVRWMQLQPAQEALATAHAKGSPLRAVSAEFRATHPNRCVGVHDAITASPDVLILPQTRVWQAYADLMTGMFDAVWRGQPVTATLGDVERRAQSMMDQAADLRARRRARPQARAGAANVRGRA